MHAIFWFPSINSLLLQTCSHHRLACFCRSPVAVHHFHAGTVLTLFKATFLQYSALTV